MTDITPREEAIRDCKWASDLSDGALNGHLDIWAHTMDGDTDYEIEYTATCIEIRQKLGTEECLLINA